MQIINNPSLSIDLYTIILETANDKLINIQEKDQVKMVAEGIFNMISFINFSLATKYFALQRQALSIRDVLSMVEFIRISLTLFNGNLGLAFKHAVNLVIIDGLCLGIDVASSR